ncbi:MAG: Gfo/Idh/MocA family oxidoreductase [Eubacteriales bacterium]|nr:Gfo/Idh/MocA family oxidoreductase [Eubacteriales bacterium]
MPQVKPVKVALIGSGDISGIYLKNMTQTFSILDVVGCSDLIEGRSRARAEEYGIRQMTNEEILNDPTIEIVVNTTYPLSHYEVSKQVLLAGKNVHSEKMMATTMAEANELMAIAKEKNLRIGMAPDTFLGAALQTARKYLDAGMIGTPLNATAMVMRGYRPQGELDGRLPMIMTAGGGIPYDMGGYYLHAMIFLLGGIKRVSGFAKTRNPIEHFENPRHPRYKEEFEFSTPNMMVASLEFEQGCYGTLTTMSESFGETPRLEIYGTKGTLVLSDPNNYGDPIHIIRNGYKDMLPCEIPFTHGYPVNSRGIGVADMAWAIRNNRPHRCSAELGYHAFEVVNGVQESCATGKVYEMKSHVERPAPLPDGFVSGTSAEACLDN